MSSLIITTRQTKSGPRYVVRYRLGGRSYPIVHAGSFKTLKEAKARRDFVAGEMAAERNPSDALRRARAAERQNVRAVGRGVPSEPRRPSRRDDQERRLRT